MAKIMWCERCERYTLKNVCPICGSKTIWKIPPKFSPEDRWGKYRRRMKRLLEDVDKGGKDR